MSEARLEIPPAPFGAVAALQRELGCSAAVAQVLVRRGLQDAGAARAWLAADEHHAPSAFAGIEDAAAKVVKAVGRGTRVVVHGDYDVDGVCSTAVLVRVLRSIGADVGWYLPSRTEDGYGLSLATVDRLAAAGCGLLITADCGIAAVGEVAAARAAGMEVVVTDHHTPRADGALPDCTIVHPGVCGYPCPQLCAAGVAYVFAGALLAAAGRDRSEADVDLDLVALATVADCVPLVGENRRLVREGLRAIAATRRVGLRALMAVSRCDPGSLDARTCGFRLAPRINAAGRLHRADAGLELMLTADPERASAIAEELDNANAERRHVEQRILFEAEGQVAQLGEQPAYVLAGEGWHPGVIGIVAARMAERHRRPCVVIALDGDEGTGSGRSIPAFDLLGGLDACAQHLARHGGHRAAAGCTLRRSALEAFRAAFVAHAASVLSEDDFVRVARVDAVVSGDELGTALAEELEALAPFGQENPEVALLVPAARLTDPRPMGEGKHLRFTVEAGGARARAVAFGVGKLPEGADGGCFDATFGLELNEFNGAVEPRLVLRDLIPCTPGPIALAGEPEDPVAAALLEADSDPVSAASGGSATLSAVRSPLDGWDRRGVGIAGTLAALVATGEPVLVVCADARARRKGLGGRLGGFAICSWAALAREPQIARPYPHLVALDPPLEPAQQELLRGRIAHLAWGDPELAFAEHVHERDLDLRAPLRAVYSALRERGEAALGDIPVLVAGRALRVLRELGLVVGTTVVPDAPRTQLERSPSFLSYQRRLEDGRLWLRTAAGTVTAA